MAKNKKSTSRKGRKTKAEQEKDSELKEWIEIVVLVAVVIVAYSRMGVVGVFLNRLCRYLFGSLYILILGVMACQVLITMVNRRHGNTSSKNPTAVLLLLIAVLLITAYSPNKQAGLKGLAILQTYWQETPAIFQGTSEMAIGGGILGAALLALTTFALDYTGTILVIIVLFVIAALLLVNLDVYKQAFRTIADYFSTTEVLEDEEEEEEEETVEEEPKKASFFSLFHKNKEEPEETAEPESLDAFSGTNSRTVPITITDIQEDDEKEEGLSSASAAPAPEPAPVRSAIDIRADAPDPSIKNDVVIGPSSMEDVVAKAIAEDDSIFISIDDLQDQTVKAAAAAAPAAKEAREIVEQDNQAAFSQPEDTTVYGQAENPVPSRYPNGMKKNRPYQLPPLRLLDPIPPRDRHDPNVEAARQKGEQLIQVLHNFDIEARLIDTHIGPAVTKFEIRPDANVKVSRIIGLADDIKMQLAVRDVRIEAPIPGHNAVGVEVPNVKAVPVKMKELIGRIPEKEKEQPLVVLLGKDLLGNVVTCRLDKMPHLLIAGATGSGKSVCMNSIITSLLLRTKPDDVKLLLVDPKKVEFTPYQKVPHLIGPVINDPTKANNALKVIVKIMEERYDVFSKAGVRNIQGYNHMVETSEPPEDGPKPKKMPYIVIIVDEMADLMAVAGKEVETSIQRITQLARAAGIHLIIATQRPSVDVITGVIKANIPSRIAFAVSSAIDSKTILDHSGAERLLGNGDMLYTPIGANAPTRVQGVFVTDEEVQRITDFVSEEAVPMYDDQFITLDGVNDESGIGGVVSADEDPLLAEVKDYVIQAQKASTSLIQRRFGIGYNRAARMIDTLEQQGVIGPVQGSKPREVYVKPEDLES